MNEKTAVLRKKMAFIWSKLEKMLELEFKLCLG